MQSNDSPFSSDDLILEVGSVNDDDHNDDDDDDDVVDNNNPWEDIDVQNIPLDIKDEMISPCFSCTSCGTVCFFYVLYIEVVVWYIAYVVRLAGSIGEMQ